MAVARPLRWGASTLLGTAAAIAVAGPAAARIGEPKPAVAAVKGTARVDPPISIAANQDLILGAIRLGATMRDASGVRASRVASTFVASSGRARAFFVVAGLANQAVSVEVPGEIVLTDAAGTDRAIIEVRTVAIGDTRETPPPPLLDDSGLLAFGIAGRVTARQGLGGLYRGLLVATAQYN